MSKSTGIGLNFWTAWEIVFSTQSEKHPQNSDLKFWVMVLSLIVTDLRKPGGQLATILSLSFPIDHEKSRGTIERFMNGTFAYTDAEKRLFSEFVQALKEGESSVQHSHGIKVCLEFIRALAALPINGGCITEQIEMLQKNYRSQQGVGTH